MRSDFRVFKLKNATFTLSSLRKAAFLVSSVKTKDVEILGGCNIVDIHS